MDQNEFKKLVEEAEYKRPQIYKILTDLLDKADFEPDNMIVILDWLNAQTIRYLIKDRGQALRVADLLNGATKKLINEMFKQGLVK